MIISQPESFLKPNCVCDSSCTSTQSPSRRRWCDFAPVQPQETPLDGVGVGVARDIPSSGETLYYFYIPGFHVTIKGQTINILFHTYYTLNMTINYRVPFD